ncbi:DEAD/DEAH box helicase [Thermodesulfobacteriota bacterium]
MARQKSHYRRPLRKNHQKSRGSDRQDSYSKPRLDPQLKPIFKKIGVPPPTPFQPDAFQLEALDKIKNFDVLVSAPTGAGKTWIASQAIWQYFSSGLRVWYASPLKALSNAIYQQFSQEFNPQNCGILTGDRKENAAAPIIVGTTEILRNQLYDSMHAGTDIQADLVILDEAHYLSDPERGVVWEEVLIYLPPRVRLLLLSATVSNPEEICSWLEENRKQEVSIVRSYERPVPLEMLFIFPDGQISPLGGKNGLTTRVKKFESSRSSKGKRWGIKKPDFGHIISCLREFDLLPAIFFLHSRADCNRAILSCLYGQRSAVAPESMKRELKAFLREYPHLEGHRQINLLMRARVGSHHAGQLPYWKALIERMMAKGYLEAIFSTSTVAAGVNFPARTVALIQSDRFNGQGFTDLTATDLQQMIGRAGRRGMDNIGFALLIPGTYQNPELIYRLRNSPPEPLISQIRINFSMTLNLLLSHKPLEIKELLERSFASYQGKHSGADIKKRLQANTKKLSEILSRAECDPRDPFEVLELIEKRAELKRRRRALSKGRQVEGMIGIFKPYLVPGRLFLHSNNAIYMLFESYLHQGTPICLAQNIGKTVRFRKRQIRLNRVHSNKIERLYDPVVEIPVEFSPKKIQELLDSIDPANLRVLELNRPAGSVNDSRHMELQEKMGASPCHHCVHEKDCHSTRNEKLQQLMRDFRSLLHQLDGAGEGLWLSFKRHLRFLKESGFVDENDRLNQDGIWASKLRLNYPLLIAEAIRKKGLSPVSPEVLAGSIAPFVWDKNIEIEVKQGIGLKQDGSLDLQPMVAAFEGMLTSMEEMRNLKKTRGFDVPQIYFWPAAALFFWAKGVPWEKLLNWIAVDEGDMASLIMRTADHLRQVTNLDMTHPRLVSVAKRSIKLILREPVLI